MNFFVKLSQHKKIIVPAVVLVGLFIFGGSYFIQDHRAEVARQTTESTQNQDQPSADELQGFEPAQTQAQLPTNNDPDTPVSNEPSAGVTTVDVDIIVEGRTITVNLDTDLRGECTLYAKQGTALLRSSTVASEVNQCRFSNFDASGAQTLQAQYHSTDQTAKGSGEISL